jgi:hypothetical protein
VAPEAISREPVTDRPDNLRGTGRLTWSSRRRPDLGGLLGFEHGGLQVEALHLRRESIFVWQGAAAMGEDQC